MRTALLLLGTCALAGATVADELPEPWRHWSSHRTLGPVDASGQLAAYVLPFELLGAAREDLADVRVIDESGSEVPFVLHARTGRRQRDWLDTKLIDRGFVPGRYTEAVADVGTDRRSHNALEVDVAATDFFAWAEVAASDDRETWRIVRARAPLYRFAEDGLAGPGKIEYAESTARWLRLRLLNGERDLTIGALRIAREVIEPAELRPAPIELERVPDSPAGETRWEARLASPLPASAVRFETSREAFHRPAQVETGDDETDLRVLGRGDLYRYRPAEETGPSEDADRERLTVEFPEARGRVWRVTVFDRSDPPIPDLRPRLLAVPRRVVLRPQAGRSYRLLYGNARAEPPVYEMVRLTTPGEIERAVPGEVGPARENEGYVSPEPWTERHPYVLWIALVAAGAVLAWLAIRALRPEARP